MSYLIKKSLKEIEKEIFPTKIILTVIKLESYSDSSLRLMQVIDSRFRSCCCLNFKKPYSRIKELFEKNKINMDKFLFIDTITAVTLSAQDTKNCIYISNPANLTDISLAYSEAIMIGKIECAVIDDLSALLVYNNETLIMQFMHDLIIKSRLRDATLLIACSNTEHAMPLLKDLVILVDAAYEVGDDDER